MRLKSSGAVEFHAFCQLVSGNNPFLAEFSPLFDLKEDNMPVLILWAVPAVLVIGGGVYLIGHMH